MESKLFNEWIQLRAKGYTQPEPKKEKALGFTDKGAMASCSNVKKVKPQNTWFICKELSGDFNNSLAYSTFVNGIQCKSV